MTEVAAVEPAFVDCLREGLPPSAVVVDPDLLAAYRSDEAALCPAGRPAVAVLPTTTEQVSHVLRTASAYDVPVVPQGARSGLSGGANAIDGSIVLSLERMDRILRIDPADRVAVVEPGVITSTLARAAAALGLSYPPDPSSQDWSTLGGNIATGAGGLCCVKYGVTADFVLGLSVVLADGSVLRTGRRTVKGVAGYDLTRLIVGSEGTLGVVTEATLALRPAPGAARTLAVVFPTTAAAGAAVAAIVAAGCVPSLLEVIDGTTLRAIEALKPLGIPSGAAALLLAQSDTGAQAASDLAELGSICTSAGAQDVMMASDASESSMLLEARRLAYPALQRLGATLVDDVAVPRSRLAAFLDGVAAIASRSGCVIGVVGHAGDGNMHPTIVVDRSDAGGEGRARQAFDGVMQLGLDLGGTITGEHGVGRLKRPWLEGYLGPDVMALNQRIKNALDPDGILNPGAAI